MSDGNVKFGVEVDLNDLSKLSRSAKQVEQDLRLASAREALAKLGRETQAATVKVNGMYRGFTEILGGNVVGGIHSITESIRGMSESAAAAVAKIAAIGGALFAGWQLGKLLDEKFKISDKISGLFVPAEADLDKGFRRIRSKAKTQYDEMKKERDRLEEEDKDRLEGETRKADREERLAAAENALRAARGEAPLPEAKESITAQKANNVVIVQDKVVHRLEADLDRLREDAELKRSAMERQVGARDHAQLAAAYRESVDLVKELEKELEGAKAKQADLNAEAETATKIAHLSAQVGMAKGLGAGSKREVRSASLLEVMAWGQDVQAGRKSHRNPADRSVELLEAIKQNTEQTAKKLGVVH